MIHFSRSVGLPLSLLTPPSTFPIPLMLKQGRMCSLCFVFISTYMSPAFHRPTMPPLRAPNPSLMLRRKRPAAAGLWIYRAERRWGGERGGGGGWGIAAVGMGAVGQRRFGKVLPHSQSLVVISKVRYAVRKSKLGLKQKRQLILSTITYPLILTFVL